MQLQRNRAKECLKGCWRIAGWPLVERRLVFGLGRGSVGPLARPACLSLNSFVVRVSGRPRLGHPGARVVEHGTTRAHDAQVLGSECRELLPERRERKLLVDETVGERREFRALPFEFTLVRDGLVVEAHKGARRSALSPPFIDCPSTR